MRLRALVLMTFEKFLRAVRYGPTSARYKIYIIDEVHMLSKNAFNALLKTLEETSPSCESLFFATTEIQKGSGNGSFALSTL
jgi:DNA polymerase-3 subunit gamma/tau